MLRVVALSSLLAIACADYPEPAGPFVVGTSRVERLQPRFGFAPDLDVLFVIDSSPAMASHHEMLVAQAAQIADALHYSWGTPGLHLGVVTSDLGAEGVDVPGCGADGGGGRLRRDPAVVGPFLSDIPAADGTRVRNYQGSLADALGRLLDVGASGCTYSRPLEAAKRALDNIVDNVGFLRPNAYLAIVFITAQDDCSFADASFPASSLSCSMMASSLPSVESYAAYFNDVKSHSWGVMVAGAIAPIPSTCDAEPAPRLHAFLDMFTYSHGETSICDPHYAEAFSGFGFLSDLLGPPCWQTKLADVDPAMPGTQVACTAQYRLADDTEGVLPMCTDDNGLCWHNVMDPGYCGWGESDVYVEIDTRGIAYPFGRATVECLVADN